jgi:hypothetical protein
VTFLNVQEFCEKLNFGMKCSFNAALKKKRPEKSGQVEVYPPEKVIF